MSEYLPRDSAGHEPTSPTSSTSPVSRPKKFNPLNDLIDTERLYVEQLTGVIRRIAAAWSRTNLPPPELDTMFRSIEAVYKANKSLYSRLKDIGSSPSSPKVLGDLLMKWVTDLDTPYTNYCTNYCSGFDDWEPVKSNHKLPEVLKAFTTSFPLSSSMQSLWTLDAVFLLPRGRLKYYRKLYNRLLKGTVTGRSDHRLLIIALEKFDTLLNMLESRQSIRVGQSNSLAETEDEVVVDLRTRSVLHNIENSAAKNFDQPMPSSVGDQNIPPRDTTNVPEGKIAAVHDTLPSEPEINSFSVRNLETRLSTARTLDIFTMNPKIVRLQFSPNNLTFSREIRLSLSVLIHFTPRVTNTEVIHRRGHVFILSDLFLICERMTPQEKAQRESGEEDMWLCYPPLAGKVLRVAEVDGQSHTLQVTVMKKESLFLETGSIDMRNALKSHLRECIEFSDSLPPPAKELPPPVPPLNVPPNKNTIRQDPDQQRNTPLTHNSTLTSARGISRYSHQQEMLPRSSCDEVARDNELTNRMPNLARPDVQLQRGAQQIPPVHNPAPGPTYQGSALRPQDYHTRSALGRSVSPPVQNFANSQSVPVLGGLPTNFNQSDRPREQAAFLRHGQPLSQQQAFSALAQPAMDHTDGSPHRRPSEPSISQGTMRKSTSMHSLASRYSHQEHFQPHPPIPSHPQNSGQPIPRTGSMGNLRTVGNRPLLPSAQISSRDSSLAEPSFDDPSPPGSPAAEPTQDLGPVTSTVSAEMKCKVFLQQQHAQWKSFGSAKLKLYCQSPTNIKQLVVASNKSVLISTIVLTDGVERVGKTGVAIELSDKGARTGVIYMLQLQNETLAAALFDSLLAGSDRSR